MQLTPPSPASLMATRPNGAQIERTDRAWRRLSLALMANGCLVLLRSLFRSPTLIGLATSLATFVVALGCLVIAYHRQRQLGTRSLLPNRKSILMLSASVILLEVCVTGFLFTS